ncbi:hypothetical protein [Bacillus sp. FSL K6-0067]|uniref:hypothetical protein n=1 Tax=Bacillus sp. FSL K6-0067 TaxID=2921412 RepID=UPI00077A2AC4|nr:hypothetical protein [Bacillus cereus]KXY15754.1 hypothetical protein AT267_30315 [Bacillus cereus]
MNYHSYHPSHCQPAFPVFQSEGCSNPTHFGTQQQLLQLLTAVPSALQFFFQNPNPSMSQYLQQILIPFLQLLEQIPSTPQTQYAMNVLQQLLADLQDSNLPTVKISELAQLFLESLIPIVQCSNLTSQFLQTLNPLFTQGILNSRPHHTCPST